MINIALRIHSTPTIIKNEIAPEFENFVFQL